MPPKGYRHLSIKEEVYRRLEEFAKSKGLASVSDALVLLLEYADIYSKLEYILQKGVSSLPQTGVNQGDIKNNTESNHSQEISRGDIASNTDANSKLSELLKTLAKKVRDIEERVRAIEYMHWGVADIGRRVQVFEGDSEEGRKILEEVKQRGRLIDRSEGDGVIVEVYDT
jgi:hypothetical protein